MKKNNKLLSALTALGIILVLSLSMVDAAQTTSASAKDPIKTISSLQELDKVVKDAGSRLLMFDLYADWCMPCRMLAPTLKDIAKEKKDKVTVYKVDTDKHPDIAAAFGVSGIPHVAFIQDGKAVYVLTGFRPKEEYIQVIDYFNSKDKKQ